MNCAIRIFFTSKKNTTKKWFSYVICMILGVITHFLTPTVWLNIVITMAVVFILASNYVGNMKSKFIMACAWNIFGMITEVLVTIFYAIILGENLSKVIQNDALNFIGSLIHTLVVLIIVKGIATYKNKNLLTEKISIYDSLQVCLIPLCSIFILNFFVKISLLYPIIHYTIIFPCVIIIFTNIFFFVLFDKLRISEKLKYEHAILKNQADYYVRLEENAKDTFEKVRIVKHDLKYKLLHLKSKVDNNQNCSLKEVHDEIDSLIGEALFDGSVQYTKNNSLNRLLNYKLFSLEDIALDVKVTIREDTYIDEVSLYTILGNTIDNAVRSFNSSMSEQKSIFIRIADDSGNLYIKISNPYDKKLKFKNGLPLSDKPDGTFHGIGLKSVKDLVENKEGFFKITTDNYIFDLEILLFDEIKHKNSYPI